ncbi:DEAD/DEAH box helicase [Leucothrix sargassi]|nr:DEAD/DEAH box helicase [Leucothrix sargassi]
MELNSYQQQVINDLDKYLDKVSEIGQYDIAFNQFWEDKVGRYDPVTKKGMQPYRNILANTPNVCIKVPTAGGKTFIGINALESIFRHYNQPTKAVIWLVPWSNLLEQTYKNLNDNEHPYRKKLNQLFNHRVEVYLKEDGLQGANFNPASVQTNLTIFVMSFASLRTKNKDGRKVYQENGYLMPFKDSFDDTHNLPDTDDTALINVIRNLKPVVVVDESHNAESDLSLEMLANLNPSFVLDLTATPKENSNIISFVPAYRLKKENMVKLPVIVYNCDNSNEVIENALHLQQSLELQAQAEEQQGGRYIRPIVLFQAQPINAKDSTTFEDIKKKLIAVGIPDDQIKIKTANINELKNIDLMSKDCPVRYIITVNALKEGWDCPFAYILATLANKSSSVDVEQILGRVLRQPYVMQHKERSLNVSYVLTSSSVFQNTLQNIVNALQASGFNKNDYRAKNVAEISDDTVTPMLPKGQGGLFDTPQTNSVDEQPNDINSIDEKQIQYQPINTIANPAFHESTKIYQLPPSLANNEHLQQINAIVDEQSKAFDQYAKSMNPSNLSTNNLPSTYQTAYEDVGITMNTTSMLAEHQEIAKTLSLPQFFLADSDLGGLGGLFADESDNLLSRNDLLAGFNLSKESVNIDFGQISQEIYQVDVIENDGDTAAQYGRIDNSILSQKFIDAILASSNEAQIRDITAQIMKKIGDMYPITDPQIKSYVGRIIEELSESQRRDILKNAPQYTKKIRENIDKLSRAYAKDHFAKAIKTREITVKPYWQFSPTLPIKNSESNSIAKRLYETEYAMNNLEKDIILKIASLPNIVFWHKNLVKDTGFALNGFFNHYPDFIIYTNKGTIILLETKGDDRDNTDTEDKIRLGEQWERLVGDIYRYFMVFDKTQMDGAFTIDEALDVIAKL